MMHFLSALSLVGIGCGFGILLVFAAKKFYVPQDPKIKDALDALPGANCGACGFSGCKAYAEAVVEREDISPTLCIPGAEEVAEHLSKITGKKAEEVKRQKALIRCAAKAKKRFNYKGLKDCRAATLLLGGHSTCVDGCLGLGTCVNVCPFGAIQQGDGAPQVLWAYCTGCGKCKQVCPKNVIEIVEEGASIFVKCASSLKGKKLKDICEQSCIKCKACEKVCKEGALKVNVVVEIDYKKCTACMECVRKCPTGALLSLQKS